MDSSFLEATSISVAGGGWFAAPGLYSEEQVAGWKRITDAVHQKRGYMFSQLWHTGRAGASGLDERSNPCQFFSQPGILVRDPTILESTPHGWRQPSPHRALDITEIPGVVEDYRKAAERAKAAGFDGVELHAGNGYLPDQFLQNGVNRRTDSYGGSLKNRTRFLLQVVEAMVSVWGGDRVAVRIAPGGRWNGMSDSDPDALFDSVVKELNQFGLAYLHIIKPRVRGNEVAARGVSMRLRRHGSERYSKGKSSEPGASNPERPRKS